MAAQQFDWGFVGQAPILNPPTETNDPEDWRPAFTNADETMYLLDSYSSPAHYVAHYVAPPQPQPIGFPLSRQHRIINEPFDEAPPYVELPPPQAIADDPEREIP